MGVPWRADPIWVGKTAVIIASGQSFTAAQARLIGIARARDKIRVIAINDCVYACWFADIAYACDARWWQYHGSLPGFSGLKVALQDCDVEGLRIIKHTGGAGFDADPAAIRTGGNGGYQALHIAAHLGVTRALLVGYDMRGERWFGNHPKAISSHVQGNMPMRLERFRELAPILAGRGMTVVNCSPGSALRCFTAGDLETELRLIESR